MKFFHILSVLLIFNYFSISVHSQRVVSFSGVDWIVKDSHGKPVGPGDNIFSPAIENVFINEDGQLVLHITRHNLKWHCAEIFSTTSFGYGRYIFEIDVNPQKIHKNIVLGLFTYDKTMTTMFNEIDIEFSRWGACQNANTQYVVHDVGERFKRFRFHTQTQKKISTHIFEWHPDKIVFQSYYAPISELHKSEPYMHYIFLNTQYLAPANENVHINMWKFQNMISLRKQHQIRINQFQFFPLD